MRDQITRVKSPMLCPTNAKADALVLNSSRASASARTAIEPEDGSSGMSGRIPERSSIFRTPRKYSMGPQWEKPRKP